MSRQIKSWSLQAAPVIRIPLCPYAQRQRVGDITIGDYWGVQKYDPQLLVEQGGTINSKEGVSCLLINTERGQHLVEKYGAKIESYPVEFSNIA